MTKHKPKSEFHIEHYWKPTPIIWRKIGDSILYGCGIIGTGGLIDYTQLKEFIGESELKIIIIITLLLGFTGKIISNFFKKSE